MAISPTTPSAVHGPAPWWSEVPAIAVPVLVAVLVVLPWTRRGWLLLLDWIPGPAYAVLPRSFWGLDGGLQAALPFAVLTQGAGRVIGAAVAGWAVVAVALALAGVAAGRMVGGPAVRRVAAGTLYVVNPMVFERLAAGQVGFLLAYAGLPMVVASIVRWRGSISWAGMRPALWLALTVAFSPHLIWLGGVALVATVVVGPSRLRALGWAALVGGLAVLMTAYAIVPAIGRPATLSVGEPDLVAYRTRADPTLGLAPNVAALHGFWRPAPHLPQDDVAGWPLFLVAIVGLAGTGLWKARRDPSVRRLAGVLAVSGAAGFLLAMGDQGPTGSFYRLLFDHLPGFAIMREPQKFAALLALAYAGGFALAAEHLVAAARGRAVRVASAGLAVALPVLYVPTLFLGLHGQVHTVRYPSSWYAADRRMGEGDGKVLFLPWHQYLSFPFTGRVIGNPADAFFRRTAIAGDNVELPNLATASTATQSAYLEFLFGHGQQVCAFGRLVADLGVEYVVLARTVDWGNFRWLASQADLEEVIDRPELVVYRNRAYAEGGRRADGLVGVPDWGALVTLANRGEAGGLYTADVQGPGPIAAEPCAARAAPASAGGAVSRKSPVRYRVEPGAPGYVVLPERFDPSWRHGDRAAVELAGGAVALPTNGAGGPARFAHWATVWPAYLGSLAVAAALLVGGLRAGRGDRVSKRRRSGKGPER